jgi:hypothetical protein
MTRYSGSSSAPINQHNELALLRADDRGSCGWAGVIQFVLDGLMSSESRRAYGNALNRFIEWYQANGGGRFGKALVQQYRTVLQSAGYAPSTTINLQLSAVRKLAVEAADNGLLSRTSPLASCAFADAASAARAPASGSPR